MSRKLVALLAVAMLSAAACGDSSDDQDAPPGDGGGAAASTEVRATDFEFDPTLVEVDPGQDVEVTFVNAGNVAHSFTSDDLGVDVEAQSGAEQTATFTAPDEDTTVDYHCRFHPSMKGEVVVGGGGAGGGSGEGSSDSDSFDY